MRTSVLYFLPLTLAACYGSSPSTTPPAETATDATCATAPPGDSCLGDTVVDEMSECVLSGGACSTGCVEALGRPVDLSGNCLGPETLLACLPGADGPTMHSCVKAAAGTAFSVSGALTPAGPAWGPCTTEEAALAISTTTPLCADASP